MIYLPQTHSEISKRKSASIGAQPRKEVMEIFSDLIGKKVIYSIFTPHGIHNSAIFKGVLKKVGGHLISIEREGQLVIVNTMCASFEEIREDN